MIEESCVSFDTARMLKDAGFDAPCTSQYSEGKCVWNVGYPDNFNQDEFGYSRPTQALAARWIREAHNLHVYAVQTNLPYTEPQTTKWEWGYVIAKVDDPNSNVAACEMHFGNYETAFEAGLKHSLELIKKQGI